MALKIWVYLLTERKGKKLQTANIINEKNNNNN